MAGITGAAGRAFVFLVLGTGPMERVIVWFDAVSWRSGPFSGRMVRTADIPGRGGGGSGGRRSMRSHMALSGGARLRCVQDSQRLPRFMTPEPGGHSRV
jgi:hypothetical protein